MADALKTCITSHLSWAAWFQIGVHMLRVDDDVRVLANVDEAYRVFRRGECVVAFGQTPPRGWA